MLAEAVVGVLVLGYEHIGLTKAKRLLLSLSVWVLEQVVVVQTNPLVEQPQQEATVVPPQPHIKLEILRPLTTTL